MSIVLYGDEAGRGPLAGPVTVGIILPLKKFDTSPFTDSKLLSHKQRENCYTLIQQLEKQGKLIGASGRATNKEIDTRGIIPALRRSVIRAIYTVLQKNYKDKDKHHNDLFSYKKGTAASLRTISSALETPTLVFDGNHTFHIPEKTGIPTSTIIKGDLHNPYIAMASIIAKVERDRYMVRMSKRLSEYDFHKHKGYGTVFHREAIATYGISNFHRASFCQNITQKKGKNSRIINPHRIDFLGDNSYNNTI